MKIDRLITIIMILNTKERVTAKELSEKFEVSVKTIRRDIETIEMAGVPIIAHKGYEGGYEIVKSYKVDKTSMTKNESVLLKNLLEGLNQTFKNKEVLSLINKFTSIEKENESHNNFMIDFSRWGKSEELTDKINFLDNAITKKKVIQFAYSNMSGNETIRRINPYKIIFKALNWYVYGYCNLKNEMRIFKLTRMKEVLLLDKEFEFENIDIDFLFKEELEEIEIILKVKKEIKAILDDNFKVYKIIDENEDNITIKTRLPYNTWVDSMILGFGNKVEVLEPQFLRANIKEKIREMNNLYKE